VKLHLLALPALGLVFGAAVHAETGSDADQQDEVVDALRAEVATLRQEVAELKAADGDRWLTERRAQEIRALVADVLADADTRVSMLQNAPMGWDGKNFVLSSPDGNWKMRLRGQLQVRWAYNYAAGQTAIGQPDNAYGFEVRRAKLKIDGNIIDPSWKYILNLAFDYDSSVQEIEVEDAIFIKRFDNGLSVGGGQFKDYFLREELVSSTSQLAVDRSYVNELFNQDRTQGIALEYAADQFKIYGSYNDGFSTRATTYNAPGGANSFTGRVEWLAAGNWKQFDDLQGWRGGEFGVMVGGAVHYQESRYGAPYNAGGRVERLTWTIDTSFEGDGWNVLAYVVGNHLDFQTGGGADQYGLIVQGGFMFAEDWDVYGQWAWWDLDNNLSTSALSPAVVSDSSIITVGVNYYIDRNNAKWTTDIGVGLDSVPLTINGIDWRADAPSQDGQVVLRSQLQLLF